MLVILTKKKLNRLLKGEYERGLNIGYQVGWQCRHMDDTKRGCIISPKLDEQIDAILKDKGLKE